jgi:hypothetical protein
MKKSMIYIFTTAVLLIHLASCKKDTTVPQEVPVLNHTVASVSADNTFNHSANMVLKWNEAGTNAVRKTGAMPPMIESRIYAMINLAMHDALNNIVQKYDSYALSAPIVKDADPDAAVAQAAHDVIVFLFPEQKIAADSLLKASLSLVTAKDAKVKGINVGMAAAEAMIEKRSNDGSGTAQYNYIPGNYPGAYRATPPFDKPPYNGMVVLPGWGKVLPFGILSSSQFVASPPYPIYSLEYATDFNEIKTMGCKDCKGRNEEQTLLGLFWLDNIPLSWNRIATTLVIYKNLDSWDAARMFGLLHMAEADVNISVFESKFLYNYWRPITAVRMADEDGNEKTAGIANWNTLGPPTPPVPEYPSNHAACAAAAAEILASFFKTDAVNFPASSNALPGVYRNYNKFSTAAREVSLSRIYTGYHFRKAVEAGEIQGRQVAKYIYENKLKEISR